MGLTSAISSLFKRWGNKRKLDNGDPSSSSSKKVKLDNGDDKTVTKYSLTPINNKVNKMVSKTQFIFNETVPETESKNIEFKEGGVLFNKDSLVKLIDRYASAFLNSEGGTLLAGITDQGVVKGVKITPSRWQSIEDTLKERMLLFRPTVPTGLFKLSKVPVIKGGNKGNNLFVIQFVFNKSVDGELFETGLHEVYIRRDGSVQGPLRPLDIRTLVISSYKHTLKRRKEDKHIEPVKELVKEEKEENVDKKKEEMKKRLKKKNIEYITF